jgi:hypothetical protein
LLAALGLRIQFIVGHEEKTLQRMQSCRISKSCGREWSSGASPDDS